jgi:hypothetical protein
MLYKNRGNAVSRKELTCEAERHMCKIGSIGLKCVVCTQGVTK